VIGAVFPGAIMGPLLDDRAQALFDPTRFQYLASADNATRVCISHARSRIKRFEDTLRQKASMGANAAGGSTRDYINLLKRATGAMLELVAGYKGSAEIFLAMERGEVDGMCGLDWSSLKSQRPDWVRDKTVNILAQTNLEPQGELAKRGVPQIWPFIRGADDRKAAELIISQQVLGRPYLAPPGVAAEPLRILRAAFAATLQDKDFLADAERTRIDIDPSSGERVQGLVERLYATPKATVERAKELIRPWVGPSSSRDPTTSGGRQRLVGLAGGAKGWTVTAKPPISTAFHPRLPLPGHLGLRSKTRNPVPRSRLGGG
jgi:hypothetical protein